MYEESVESYDKNIVHQLTSRTIDEMEQNVARIVAWQQQWLADHPRGITMSTGGGYEDDESDDDGDEDDEE